MSQWRQGGLAMTRRLPADPAPGPLEGYSARFDDLFDTLAGRQAFRRYLEGLLLPTERNKTLTALANTEPVWGTQHKEAQGLQWFLSESSWSAEQTESSISVVAAADRSYASLKLLSRCGSLSKPVTVVTRLRLDAALYEPAPPRRPGQKGRPRLKGERLPNLSVVADDPTTVWEAAEIANWYGSGERGRDRFCYGCVVLDRLVRRTRPLDFGARSRRRFQDPSPPVYEPRCRSAEGPLLVRDALAVGGDLPGSAQAPGVRDAETVVGDGYTAHHPRLARAVLADRFVGRLPDDTGGGCRPAGGLVPQAGSHLLRRFGAGAQRVVGT